LYEVDSAIRYIADWAYALPTTYFFLVAIALCLIGFWSLKLAPASFWRQAWWQKVVGVFRFVSYRRYEVKALRWQTPSIAVMFLLAAGAVFFFGQCISLQES
jgi:ferric-chelate reductase